MFSAIIPGKMYHKTKAVMVTDPLPNLWFMLWLRVQERFRSGSVTITELASQPPLWPSGLLPLTPQRPGASPSSQLPLTARRPCASTSSLSKKNPEKLIHASIASRLDDSKGLLVGLPNITHTKLHYVPNSMSLKTPPPAWNSNLLQLHNATGPRICQLPAPHPRRSPGSSTWRPGDRRPGQIYLETRRQSLLCSWLWKSRQKHCLPIQSQNLLWTQSQTFSPFNLKTSPFNLKTFSGLNLKTFSAFNLS